MCESTLDDDRLLFSGSNKIPPQVQRQGKLLLPGQVNLRGLYGWLCGGCAVVAKKLYCGYTKRSGCIVVLWGLHSGFLVRFLTMLCFFSTHVNAGKRLV